MKVLIRLGENVINIDAQGTGVPYRADIVRTGATRNRRVENDMPLRIERRPTGDITTRGNNDAIGVHSGGHMRNTRVVAYQQPPALEQCRERTQRGISTQADKPSPGARFERSEKGRLALAAGQGNLPPILFQSDSHGGKALHRPTPRCQPGTRVQEYRSTDIETVAFDQLRGFRFVFVVQREIEEIIAHIEAEMLKQGQIAMYFM